MPRRGRGTGHRSSTPRLERFCAEPALRCRGVSVLFADLRGYTTLSQSLSADTVSSPLDILYDECAAAIWEFDGLLNKTVGDAIMAIFNFPIRHDDHAERAVLAAPEI